MNRAPFDIEHPQTWQQVQTLLELHSHGETGYDVEMRRRAVRALLDWAANTDAGTEAAPDDVKQELLRHYATKTPTRFLQLDAWANARGFPTESDTDGDWICWDTTDELMASRPHVRVLIPADCTQPRGDIQRLLRKIAGLPPIAEGMPASGEAPLPVDSFDEWVAQAAIAVGRVAQTMHDCQISGCTDSARDAMRAVLPAVEHLAGEFRRLVERAESQAGDEQ